MFSKLREARDPTNYRDKAVKIAVKQQLGRSPSSNLGRDVSVQYSTFLVRRKPR